MSLSDRVAVLVHRWRIAHYERSQLVDTLKYERSVISARFADDRLRGCWDSPQLRIGDRS
ncbi:hypothetical protein NOCA2210021 [metagenome]|uniref:Uncharacterized protein n=1 Tax=metagenome TaxID=256318 RepID=A0A2P2BY54_9ZZZZ